MVVHAEMNAAAGPVVVPYPPTPQNSLFFYINDRIKVQVRGEEGFLLQPRSVLVGPQLTRVLLNINQNHKAVRVGFHPGGLHRLLGISLREMIDDNYDAADVFGHEMEEVNEQLQEAESFDGIKEVVEQFLLQRSKILKPSLPFDKAMLELMRLNGNVPIEKIASLSCLSLRQFERVCKTRIGIPAKSFARLVRFSRAYRLHESSPQMTWTAIAYECGYFDQMHLIRDFREFAAATPGEIEKELQHIPVRMQATMRL
mgnify:CR=1 FL=1